MSGRLHPRGRLPQGLWANGVWPVLAGTVTAVGVVGASSAFPVVGLLVAYASLALFAVVTAWGLSSDFAIPHSRVVPIGLCAALAIVVLVGLCHILPRSGLLVGVSTGLSSPAALALLSRLRTPSARPEGRSAAPGVLVDPVMLDRRFDDIVRQLKASGDFPEY